MVALHVDSQLNDTNRRERLFAGDLFVYSPTETSLEFCSFAQKLISAAFRDADPRNAQWDMPPESYAELLSSLKPEFIHHPESKRLVSALMTEFGCDPSDSFFDVPRMRTSTSDGYLTTGIAYAWHPHRDTWYSAPSAQVNWWLPILPIETTNTVAFHPAHFSRRVENTSADYNYYEWNKKHRASAGKNIKKDERPLPRPTESIERDSEIRVVCPVGGLILFSGAQLHSSVPNDSGVTRFSIDFRTVNSTDIANGRGAPTQDVACTGSNIRDFVRVGDYAPMADEIVELFRDGTEARGDLVYKA